jgi:hypothetical protein
MKRVWQNFAAKMNHYNASYIEYLLKFIIIMR